MHSAVFESVSTFIATILGLVMCVMYINPLYVLANAVLGYHCIELRSR